MTVRVFLCGDVMTGRGIDQIMPHPSNPVLHEGYARSAVDYVRLAEEKNGPLPRRVDPSYVWGAALGELGRMRPDVRIINLETSITRCDDFVPKDINYRMHPDNSDCLKAAGIDCCVLANNHVLDWSRAGLIDTLAALERLQIKTAGAGRNLDQARAPAVLDLAGGRRLLVFSFASVTSGTPWTWAAKADVAGVNILKDLSEAGAAQIAEQIARAKQPHDAVIVSLHWGPNWGYEILDEQRRFAHTLIERAGVSIVHGHSSHHAKAIEVYGDRLILYGCGDFLNDYEGIGGYEGYRGDLALMYFADISPDGTLAALEIVPLQLRKFQLVRPPPDDIAWMQQVLDRESRPFGAGVALRPDGRLLFAWPKAGGPAAGSGLDRSSVR